MGLPGDGLGPSRICAGNAAKRRRPVASLEKSPQRIIVACLPNCHGTKMFTRVARSVLPSWALRPSPSRAWMKCDYIAIILRNCQ